MNLDNVTFTSTTSRPSVDGPAPAPPTVPITKDAEVVDDITDICDTCQVAGSSPTSDGTCSVCGAVWVDDEDDFEVSLNLLTRCHFALESILHTNKLTKRMIPTQESLLRDLAMEVDDFLDTYINDSTD